MMRRLCLPLLLALAAVARAAEAPEAMLRRAAQLAEQGKAARAATIYKDFLKAHPDHSQTLEAEYRLAQCLDSLGWVDEAIEHLEKVAQAKGPRFRHRADALYQLGKLHASAKNYERAAQLCEALLAEGAGLYEDEALSLCGGYYAILKRPEEAAAKFNLLKRRPHSRLAQEAAYKLALLWLRAGNLPLAVQAVDDLAARFPENPQARGLMLQIADAFRRQRRFDKAVAACAQLRKRFPRSREAQAAGYVLGLCLRDQKQLDKAVATLDDVARQPENRKSGLSAEALLAGADILYAELGQRERAMARYDEAAKMAREHGGDRREAVLEQCYFRLAEHHFGRRSWSVALEYYTLLRQLGSRVNVLPRILKCQAELEKDPAAAIDTPADVALIEQKIEQNPGTFTAAEADVFLTDLQLAEAVRRQGPLAEIIGRYEAVLRKYPDEVLAQDSLESYVLCQLGLCHARGDTPADWKRATAALEKALAADPETPYKRQILESMARVADQAGDTQKAFAIYQRLFALAEQKVAADPDDATERQRMSEYLRGFLTRAEQKDSIEEAVAIAQGLIDKRGPFSEAARHALFYLGDLHYLRKDFSRAAATYKQFVRAYGPKQNPQGDVINPPWKPGKIDEQVEQVYEAATRVAHCWYMQGHTPNMLKAYQWLIDNLGHRNTHVAEARYWLTMEMAKGRKGETREAKLAFAEALWKSVVHPDFEFYDRDYRKRYHFWVDDRDARKYVKAAILKAGEALSEAGDHERAAGCFAEYLELYPASTTRRGRRAPEEARPDELRRIARYALGREYIALGDTPKLIECYRVYVDALRDDRFRVSALQLLGYHAARAGEFDIAVEAYATLLDEYGQNEKDDEGKPIPLPQRDRLRRGRYRWDGIRVEPPEGLDLGQARFALGFVYWRKEDWANCVRLLSPFADNPQLFDDPSRPRALYMAAQSYFRGHDYARGLTVLRKLLHDHPGFEAIEEAQAYAARGCAETGQWAEIADLHRQFVKKHPRSPHRPHMDLFAALATLKQGNADEGVAGLTSIAESDTYEDVKADAYFHLAGHILGSKVPNHRTALLLLDKSIALYPRERACLAAARCCIELGEWGKAKALLERTTRDFPAGNPQIIDEAKRLLPGVLKQMARQR